MAAYASFDSTEKPEEAELRPTRGGGRGGEGRLQTATTLIKGEKEDHQRQQL